MPTHIRELAGRLGEQTRRLALVRRFLETTGLGKALTLRGAATLIEAGLRGKTGPSTLMRFFAANSPRKKALVFRERSWNFAEFDGEIDRLAAGLRRRGIGPEKSCLLLLKNRPEFIFAQHAIGRAGGAAVSASWRSTADELSFVASDCDAKIVLFDADVVDVVASAMHKIPGAEERIFVAVGGSPRGFLAYDDLLAKGAIDHTDESEEGSVVIYTSGTTGKPKGAVRKFPREATFQAMSFIAETPMRCEDVHLVACPLYHSTAFGFAVMSHTIGNTVVILDEFRPTSFLEIIERHRITNTAVVPTMLHRVLALGSDELRRYDKSSLRAIFTGGAPLPRPLGTQVMDAFGSILYNFYGATETGLVTLAKPADLLASPGTIGRPVPGNDIRLLDDAGHAVTPGRVGELYVKNGMLIAGYHKNDAATRASMKDGYFSVGDLARCDALGAYHIEGRKRDMVISGGVNVYPAEVESVLESHPDVSEAAVVGAPDDEWGERVVAFVVARSGAVLDEEALKTFCREHLAGPKNPRGFVFLSALPRNPTGKVLKRELAEMYINQKAPSASA